MWRIWTRGWGPRDWWRWVKSEGFALWVAQHLPRRIALLTFVRVSAACGLSPELCTYETCYKAWERCRREDRHTGPCNGTPCRCTKPVFVQAPGTRFRSREVSRCCLTRGHEGDCK